ncbi:hypothetical protein WOLCODRAFT_19192 [Wolfiporia cocos MD-104 SS10]|uniref:DUF6533 domain-containing protein n=1 Tax=Wolfiporia cocos (strain MD-104) TaxID=742152 RepID=A0A2H3JSB9_WOLCO|nr:hypothetical protein WOLCODRAFT_19192 [Wolfiporia cocos MD-104 SS10]
MGITKSLVLQHEYEFIAKCCSFSSTTLFLYEHAITFAKEVQFIWNGSTGFTSIIFFFNRCLMLGTAALSIFKLMYAADIFPFIVFLALRMYAIAETRRWISVIAIFLLGMCPAAVDFILAVFAPMDSVDTGLLAIVLNSWRSKLHLAARICVIFAESLVILLAFGRGSCGTEHRGGHASFSPGSVYLQA